MGVQVEAKADQLNQELIDLNGGQLLSPTTNASIALTHPQRSVLCCACTVNLCCIALITVGVAELTALQERLLGAKGKEKKALRKQVGCIDCQL